MEEKGSRGGESQRLGLGGWEMGGGGGGFLWAGVLYVIYIIYCNIPLIQLNLHIIFTIVTSHDSRKPKHQHTQHAIQSMASQVITSFSR